MNNHTRGNTIRTSLMVLIGILMGTLIFIHCGTDSGASKPLPRLQGDEGMISDEDHAFPLVFSPVQVIGIFHPRDYFQAIRVEDELTRWRLWELGYLNEDTYYTFIATSDDAFRVGYNKPTIRTDLFWFLPDKNVFEDPSLMVTTETNPDKQTRIINITHQLPDGNTVQRIHVHALEPSFDRFQNREDDVKGMAADLMMFNMVFFGIEETQDGFLTKLNGEEVPVKRMMMFKMSVEANGLMWGGLVAGESVVERTEKGIAQSWNHRQTRDFIYGTHPNQDELFTLTHEAVYYTEIQHFKMEDSKPVFLGVRYRLPEEQELELTVSPAIPLTASTTLQGQADFQIRFGDTGKAITGIIHWENQNEGIKYDIKPDEPSWCAERPMVTSYQYGTEMETIRIQTKMEQ